MRLGHQSAPFLGLNIPWRPCAGNVPTQAALRSAHPLSPRAVSGKLFRMRYTGGMRATKTHFTSHEAARHLGVTARRARALAASGRIAGAVKIGRDWLIPVSARVTPGTRGPSLRSATDPTVVVLAPRGKNQALKQARQRRFRKSAAIATRLAHSAVVFRLPRSSVRFAEPDLEGEDLT